VSNPFSTENLLPTFSRYPVAKGDTAGHPFYGNQWTDNAIAEHIKSLIAQTDNNSSYYTETPSGNAGLVNPRNSIDVFGTRHIKPNAPEKARRINDIVYNYGKEMLKTLEENPSMTVAQYAKNLRDEATKQLAQTKDDAPKFMVTQKKYRYTIWNKDDAEKIVQQAENDYSVRRKYNIREATDKFKTTWYNSQQYNGTDKMLFSNYVYSLLAGKPTPMPSVSRIKV
jgi:hypothetical protein